MNFLEIQFALRGKTLPADHGYSLYSALKNIVSENSSKIILEDSPVKDFPPEVILSTIPGIPDRQGLIYKDLVHNKILLKQWLIFSVAIVANLLG